MFTFLNGVLLRTLHHWADVPYQLNTMFRSDLVQVALSIFWTILAWYRWSSLRGADCACLWFCGAVLMGWWW